LDLLHNLVGKENKPIKSYGDYEANCPFMGKKKQIKGTKKNYFLYYYFFKKKYEVLCNVPFGPKKLHSSCGVTFMVIFQIPPRGVLVKTPNIY
jgi:hypothetical protein